MALATLYFSEHKRSALNPIRLNAWSLDPLKIARAYHAVFNQVPRVSPPESHALRLNR